MKILYVGNAGGLENTDRFYLFPPRLINGFIRNGHQVQIFNDKDVARSSNIFKSSRFGVQKTNELLQKNCCDYMPDLMVIANCQFIQNETLVKIRNICPAIKIVHLNVDPLSDHDNCNRIQNRAGYVDGIFITTAGEDLRKFSNHKTFCAFIPNLVDPSIDTGKSFNNPECSIDLFFAAGAMRCNDHRQKIISHILQKTPNMKIDIHGAGINNSSLFGVNYMHKLSTSKMGLVINKTEEFYLYASDRMSQYMANGLLVFANSKPKFTDIFTTDEFVPYDNENDLVEKINYYHTHDNERIKIAAQGYQKIHQVFHNQLVADYVVNLTFSLPATAYPWPSIKYGTA